MDAPSSSSAGQVIAAPMAMRRNLDQKQLQLLTRQWEADASQLLRPVTHPFWPWAL